MGPTYAVWVGRVQPFHLGHLEILRRSLRSQECPHVNGIVCHDDAVLDDGSASKHTRCYNPFTPWERYIMVRTCLTELGFQSRVESVFIPYLWPSDWGRTKLYLPDRFVMCTTNKDREDSAKVEAWDALGWRSLVIDMSDVDVLSSTTFRHAVLDGRDWREFVHESIHDYFASIDGPARFLRSAAEVRGRGGPASRRPPLGLPG